MVAKIAGAAAGGAVAPSPAKADFASQMRSATSAPRAARPVAPASTKPQAGPEKTSMPVAQGARPPEIPVADSMRPRGARLIGAVQQAQARLDKLLQLAESGRTFTAAELIAFQAHAYRASQELEMAGKVVEKGSSAVKQTLQTQI